MERPHDYGVIKNVIVPESALIKGHSAINDHAVLKAVVAKIIRVARERSETDLSDLSTKCITGEHRWE